MGALAEFERDLIQERTKAGLRAAKKRGKRLGLSAGFFPRHRSPTPKPPSRRSEKPWSGIAEILGVNRSTLQRAMVRDIGAHL